MGILSKIDTFLEKKVVVDYDAEKQKLEDELIVLNKKEDYLKKKKEVEELKAKLKKEESEKWAKSWGIK